MCAVLTGTKEVLSNDVSEIQKFESVRAGEMVHMNFKYPVLGTVCGTNENFGGTYRY